MVVDPFGHQTPRLVQRCLGMMYAIQRGAGLECRHIIRAQLAQIAVGGDHRASQRLAIWLTSLPIDGRSSLLRVTRN